MKITSRILAMAFILCSTMAFSACWSSRVHSLTDTKYPRKGNNDSIEMVVGKYSKAYESIAIIDSNTYSTKDDNNKRKMLDDIKKRGLKLGADAVQDIRILPVKVQGVVFDEGVPVTGAWKQGRYNLYFMRGEAIKFVANAAAVPGEQNPVPVAAKAPTEKKKKKTKEIPLIK